MKTGNEKGPRRAQPSIKQVENPALRPCGDGAQQR